MVEVIPDYLSHTQLSVIHTVTNSCSNVIHIFIFTDPFFSLQSFFYFNKLARKASSY